MPSSIVVGKVLKIDAHPNADRLRVALVDVGKGRRWQIVCGASNLAVQQYVPVALPGTTLPNGATIKTTEIRDVASRGMVCSETELGIAKKSDGIMALDEATPGTTVTKLLGLDDDVLDLEIPPNRPDMLSVLGCAREYAALMNKRFMLPKWRVLPRGIVKNFRVSVESKEGCSFYGARRIDGVHVVSSPHWLQNRLRASGVRPINAVVDATNYVMVETGQPLHAFDGRAFPNGNIIVRQAKPKEVLRALDGINYALPSSAVVIANAERTLAIGGIMGSESSGIVQNTTSVVLEAAVFDPVLTRRTSKALRLQTEGSYRHERGTNPQVTLTALDRTATLIAELTGGAVLPGLATHGRVPQRTKTVSVSLERMNAMLSLRLTPSATVSLVKRSLSRVRSSQLTLTVTPPHWRNDLESEEDVIEEVARLHGYERLQKTYPVGPLRPSVVPPMLETERKLLDALVGFGGYEMKSYPWYSDRRCQEAGLSSAEHVVIANPFSADARLLRLHLHPNLLASAALASKARSVVFFVETGRVFRLTVPAPFEEDRLSFVVVGDDAYRLAKGYVNAGFASIGIPSEAVHFSPTLHPLGSGEKILAKSDVGVAMRLSDAERQRWKCKRETAFVELSLSALTALCRRQTYVPASPYPPVLRDLSFWIPASTSFAQVASVITAEPLCVSHTVFDVFEKEGKRALAVHLTFQATDRTLEAQDAERALHTISTNLTKRFHAEIR